MERKMIGHLVYADFANGPQFNNANMELPRVGHFCIYDDRWIGQAALFTTRRNPKCQVQASIQGNSIQVYDPNLEPIADSEPKKNTYILILGQNFCKGHAPRHLKHCGTRRKQSEACYQEWVVCLGD